MSSSFNKTNNEQKNEENKKHVKDEPKTKTKETILQMT